jgi:hypothetical protein
MVIQFQKKPKLCFKTKHLNLRWMNLKINYLNEDLHGSYTWLSNVRTVISRKLCCIGHAARIGGDKEYI